MKSGHLEPKADTLEKVSASSGRPTEREADTTDRADTFAGSLHTRARFKKTHTQVSVVSALSASRIPGGLEQADTFSKVSAEVSADLWTTERPADGEDAQRVAWHIAYLLAGEMSAEERAELNRLRRVQRWLSVAPERRAALRLALIASVMVWMSAPHATGSLAALNLPPCPPRPSRRQRIENMAEPGPGEA